MRQKMEEIRELLVELARFKSTRENPKELERIVDFVEKRFLEYHTYMRRFRKNGKPSLLVTFRETYKPQVLFVGHLDVVEGDPDQFDPRIEGNKLYARGAMDMKGPDSVMIQVFLDIAEEGPPYPDVGLMLTTDEEVGSQSGVAYLIREEGVSSDFAVIPDGGENFSLIVEEKGAFHALLRTKGRAAHGSRPWDGDNAIERLLKLYEEVKKDFPGEPCGDSTHWHNTLNLGKIKGGDAVNRVPDSAEMGLDVRFVAPWTVEKMKRYFADKIKEKREIEMEILSVGEVVKTPTDDPLLQRYRSVAEKTLGRRVPFSKEHGATDARFFAEKGIPVLITYPVGGNIHGKNEWVNLDSLDTLYRIFMDFIGTLRRGEE